MNWPIVLLVVTLAVAIHATLDEEKQKVKKWSQECRKETEVSAESVQKLHNNVYTDDPRLKEYVLCILIKLDFVSVEGEFNVERIKYMFQTAGISEDTVRSLITKCAVKKHRPEETAYEAVLCWYRSKSLS